MNLGSAIRSIRKQLGITQHELADKSGISQTSLSQIENAVKRPSNKTIQSICGVLEIPEAVIYILAMQDSDVPTSKKSVYDMLFPSIKNLALQIVGNENKTIIERCESQTRALAV
ncbi:MAG: helix-turn-helix transcriptional regulator [Chitinophagales bacterium]|nr:helix-turn-helix transcriptional regulator [Chitinophagaceae bacterium]MCB9065518.1 helix-turn-helix transcriptional regulator [Chitinophagales bacterium]